MSDDAVYFYGIDGTRGGPLIAPLPVATVEELTRVEPTPVEADASVAAAPVEAPAPPPTDGRVYRSFDPNDARFKSKPRTATYRSFDPNDPRFKPKPRVHRFRGLVSWLATRENDLSAAGWAVIFPLDVDPRVVEALRPLLELRHRQAAGVEPGRYKACCGRWAYRAGETAEKYLARHNAAFAGAIDPDRFPYYVLLVGGPTQIPFAFQYELDSQYAVGRICFDTPEEYAAYARAVVDAEQAPPRTAKLPVAVFATQHVGDPPTGLSARHLAPAVAARLKAAELDCDVETYTGAEATRERALGLLGGERRPALLFTVTHGMAFECHEHRHLRDQGALVCHDPRHANAIGAAREHYVGADDISPTADVRGLIAFFFGCYTAGTPAGGGAFAAHLREALHAPQEFVARLPQRLLAHPNGPALAVIGHVDQAWSCSFMGLGGTPDTTTFCSALWGLAKGWRVGHALECFGHRASQHATGKLTRYPNAPARHTERSPSDELRAFEDARNYVLLGDPAVRLPAPA